jgi:predicted permease
MFGLPRDFQLALRSIRSRPGFAVAVILTFAIGLGANAAIFSYLSALVLRPLPFPEAERLVRIQPLRGDEPGMISALEVRDIAEQTTAFTGVASFRNSQYTVGGDGPPEVAGASMNSWNLFDVLGVRPQLGRTWPASDDGTRVFSVVLGHDLWQRRFGGDPTIVGKAVQLDSYDYTVLGVLPAGFDFPGTAQVYRRLPGQDLESRTIRTSSAVARLRSDVTLAQAQRELDAVSARLAEQYPESNRGVRLVASPLRDYWIGDARRYLLMLGAAVVCVVLVACTNVAGLLLARAVSREREMAVLSALGAGRRRLARQGVVEAVVLAALGGAAGMLVARWSVSVLDALVRVDRPAWMAVAFDWPVLAYAAVSAIVVGMLAGAVPAFHASATAPGAVLRAAGRSVSSSVGRRALRRLVGVQIALAVVLLACAGLVTRSLQRLNATPLGFDAERLLTLKIDPPWTNYDRLEQTAPFYRRMLDAIGRVPGVESAATNDALPIVGMGVGDGR